MSMLGEVVFCVDCDALRNRQANGTDSVSAGPPEPPPRRMAVKRDANGDPLCAACLDARHSNRRAEFLMHEGRAPIPGYQPAPSAEIDISTLPDPTQKPKSGLIRIVRQRGPEPKPEPARPAGRRAKREREAAPAPAQLKLPDPARVPRARDRGAERQFVMLAAEMGFTRAQQLLDELKSRIAKVTRGAAP